MAVSLKTSDEIESISRTGRELTHILESAAAFMRPGSTTREADEFVRGCIDGAGALSLLAEHTDHGDFGRSCAPFPGFASFSVNEVASHGVPDDRPLDVGDLVTIDCAISIDGWCADAAVSVVVGAVGEPGSIGEPATARAALAAASRAVMVAVVAEIAPGTMWSSAIENARRESERLGVFLLDGPCGHGIGRRLHEAPGLRIVNGRAALDFPFREGMVLTIEPIVSFRRGGIRGANDGIGLVTTSGDDACYEEVTVAVVRGGSRVLTPSCMFVR